jgi:putative salt-induced outer membrane protein YdiY
MRDINRKNENNEKMTTILKISRLAIAAMLLACATAAQAQTNAAHTNTTTTITTNGNTITTTTTTIITTTTVPANGATTTNAALAHPNVATNANAWKSSIAVGVTIARGNTDTTLASFTATTEKKWLKNDLVFGADALYGETKAPNEPKQTENAEILHGYSQYNRSIENGFYDYMRIDGFHDGIADIKYRLTLAPGLGYFFITNKTMDLSAEIGPGYIREQVDGDSESFATLRMGQKFHYNISPVAKVWEIIEFLPQVNNFNNYIINFETGIDAALTKDKKLSLRTVLRDSYNNVPAPGRLKNDLQLIAGLAYKF